jgi:NAD(P)-dependent dehydrogenase (short-subunit alcohol dehydrogenase family)
VAKGRLRNGSSIGGGSSPARGLFSSGIARPLARVLIKTPIMKQSRSETLSDPRTKYAAPPFPTQKQSIPGEDRRMEPKADHGEDRYVGHGRLKNLVALISGGDSGIGRAVVIAFAREGADVAFTYLEEEADARETERLVKEAGRRVLSFRSDQTDREACEKVVSETVEQLGQLDILVNNAAFQKSYESLEEIPDDELKKSFSTNIEAFFYLSRAALPHLPPGGSIINTTSIQAFDPSPALAPYAATKAAIANFTLSLSRLAAKSGVRVNGVAPGPVWTPLIPSTLPKESVEEFGASTLFKRPAQPAELAPVYVFLASDEASYISGEIYGVIGGRKQL